MALYDDAAPRYDLVRRADPDIAHRLARLLKLGDDDPALDLACGTGNYTLALNAMGGHWLGVDANRAMLDRAIAKAPTLDWINARAEQLPFANEHFESVSTVLSVHHYTDKLAAFTEVRRVTRSRFATFACTREQTANYWIWHYFPRFKAPYLATLPSQREMSVALRRAGFRRVTWQPYWVSPHLRDGFLYAGKFDPSVYLDPIRRAGMSTFSVLDDPSLFTDGLAALQHDVDTGAWHRQLARSNDRDGDYLFGLAET
ncbi:MAG: methyltransferase domain-containing protein [Chromatiales bacterium]|nr:methyltransferase domain-containing protein [Chromatiales bacterium]